MAILFPTATAGLPVAHPPESFELVDGDRFDLRIAPVTKRFGDDIVRMLAYNGSIPGPTLRVRQGSELVVNVTNDGDLANAVLHPDHETNKIYWLWLDEHVPDADPRLERMTLGVPLARGRFVAHAASVSVLHRTDSHTELMVTLREGKNRQIRRMCRELRFKLTHLHRKAIGPLSLGELPVGEWRPLDGDEVDDPGLGHPEPGEAHRVRLVLLDLLGA